MAEGCRQVLAHYDCVLVVEVQVKCLETVLRPDFQHGNDDLFRQEVLRQNTYHLRVPLIRVLLQRPVPLQTQLHIPQCSYCINGRILDLVLELEIGRHPPKLDKRRHELTLIALNANMRQTYCQVVLQQALNHTASIDLL